MKNRNSRTIPKVSPSCFLAEVKPGHIPKLRDFLDFQNFLSAFSHFSRVKTSGLCSTMVISFFAVGACDLFFFLLCACTFFLLFNSCFLMESTHQRALFWR